MTGVCAVGLGGVLAWKAEMCFIPVAVAETTSLSVAHVAVEHFVLRDRLVMHGSVVAILASTYEHRSTVYGV